MPAPQYICDTEGNFAYTSSTKKTAVGVKAHANSGLLLLGYFVSMDGTSAAATPVTVEIDHVTWATNAPGTNSSSSTPIQKNGRVLASGFTSGKAWTAQPTVLTTIHPEQYLTPNNGLLSYDFLQGTEPDCGLGEGFALSITAAASVGVRAGLIVCRA